MAAPSAGRPPRPRAKQPVSPQRCLPGRSSHRSPPPRPGGCRVTCGAWPLSHQQQHLPPGPGAAAQRVCVADRAPAGDSISRYFMYQLSRVQRILYGTSCSEHLPGGSGADACLCRSQRARRMRWWSSQCSSLLCVCSVVRPPPGLHTGAGAAGRWGASERGPPGARGSRGAWWSCRRQCLEEGAGRHPSGRRARVRCSCRRDKGGRPCSSRPACSAAAGGACRKPGHSWCSSVSAAPASSCRSAAPALRCATWHSRAAAPCCGDHAAASYGCAAATAASGRTPAGERRGAWPRCQCCPTLHNHGGRAAADWPGRQRCTLGKAIHTQSRGRNSCSSRPQAVPVAAHGPGSHACASARHSARPEASHGGLCSQQPCFDSRSQDGRVAAAPE